MTHYRLTESEPSAIVLAQNPSTGSYEESKMYQGRTCKEIFLNDKQNFAFQFFNPLQTKIGVKISLNGNSSQNLIVINPGQSVFLDRFIGEQRKMLFETYTVDGNNSQVQQAIAANGDVKFEFYKEKQQLPIIFSTCSARGFGGVYDTNDYSTTIDCNYKHSTRRFCKSSSNITFDSLPLMDQSKDFEDEIETGRVEKGDVSNQNLERVNVEFENYSFLTINYKLLPTSQQRIENKEVRNYCTKCSYRIRKSNWVYCPKCGNKLD